MLTAPLDACCIPAPEPVPLVVMDTFGYWRWYAAAQSPISGNSSVLPVSERACGPGAGVDGMPPTGPDDADGNPGAVGEPGFVPPPHAATSASGTAVTTASSIRYRSATDRCPSLSA